MLETYKNNIKDNALLGLSNGFDIAAKAVAPTLGGRGTNSILEEELYPYYRVSKDAYSIIQSIHCEDPLENQSIKFLKDATDSQNKIAKDGRTTMVIINNDIIKETLKQGADYLDTVDELQKSISEVDKLIDEQKKNIDLEDIEQVATIASNSPKIGKLIGEIYQKVGKNGNINLEGSGGWFDEVEYIDGVKFPDTSWLSPIFANDGNKSVLENPVILISKSRIDNPKQIDSVIRSCIARQEKGLVIMAKDIEDTVVNGLITQIHKKYLNLLIIKPPTLWRDYIFEDFAKVTGATIVDPTNGLDFKGLALNHLGHCDKIICDDEETVILPSVDFSEHLAHLKSKKDKDSELRTYWLNTKTAILRLGAINEGDLSLLLLKAKDALHSSKLALQDGIVAGGGVALLNVSRKITNPILKEALKAPFKQIVKNGRGNFEEIESKCGENTGFNDKTKKIVDMYEDKIIDSAQVVKNAVRNAIGVASLALGTHNLISLPKKDLSKPNQPIKW
jgi:chaperonin GroEL